jgi:hypothetical protein
LLGSGTGSGPATPGAQDTEGIRRDELALIDESRGRVIFVNRTANGTLGSADAPLLRTIGGARSSLSRPTAAAFDPERDELFVADRAGRQILVFDASADGDAPPKRAIRGPATGIDEPAALDYSAAEKQLRVVDGGTVIRFERSASGDAAGIR